MSKLSRRDFLKTTGAVAVGAQLLSVRGALAKDCKKCDTYSRKLPQRVLGKTGVSVSILGLGGAGTLATSEDLDLCTSIVNEAIDLGINYIDTAPNYGKSEERIGQIMAKRRKEVFLATKVEDRTYDGAMKQVENSLKLLQTDMIDLVQVHHIMKDENVKALGAPNGVIRALQKLRDEKVIRFIGVTGHPQYAPVKETVAMYDWDTFMCFINPLASTRPALEEQIPIAQRKKMGIIAMKAFGGGTPAACVGHGPGQSTAPLLLKYALSMPLDNPAAVVIPAVSNLEQLRQNVEIARNFKPMTKSQCEALEARMNAPEKS